MVLVVDSARRRDWHGNAASTRRFRWSRPHDCADFFLQVIVILSFMGLAQRYLAEFYPFLIFAFLFFLRSGRLAFQLRYLLIALVAVSVVINSLTTVSWLLEADTNVPAETKATWNEFLGKTSPALNNEIG